LNWEDELELRKAERERLEERKYAALRERARQEKEYKDKLAGRGWGYQIQSVDGVRNPNFQPAFKAVPTGRGVPAYQPRSTGRGAPAYQPVSTGRGVPTYQPISTGMGVVPTREASPVRGYNGYTGDTRGVQESWWDGADMGPGMDYMDQFPQIDGSDDSMREYMMGRRDMSGTIYDPTPSNFVPNAILDKPYTPSLKRQQKPSIWSNVYNSLNSIYDEYSPQLDSIWDNVPNIPADAFDAGEYVLDNFAQPVQNFFSDAFTPIKALTYDSMTDTASGIWGDLTDWLSGDDEIKAEKAELDKYLEDAKYRYVNIHGVAFDEDARKAAIAQFYKDKRLGKLNRR